MTKEEIIALLSTELNREWPNGITCLMVEDSGDFMFSNIPQSFFLPIVVPCFIAAFCCVPITGIMKRGLLLLGKNSTYMWLTHSWLIYKFLQPVIFAMHDVVANLIVLVIIDLPIAFCFKSLEGKVSKLLSDKCGCVTQ